MTPSSQEMARRPDGNAGEAVKRVVAATIVDNRYVLIRGLGGRYASTLLNNVQLPSPEPDEQAVPLDLFPSALLSNLNVVKSYSVHLPGTFAGGALLIETSSYPTKLEASLRLQLSGDTVSTFRERGQYKGGALDYLGWDDGSRRLPSLVPRNYPVRQDDVLDNAAV